MGPTGPSAEFLEMFEWADGNAAQEDRRGYFVTLEGEYIRRATVQDDYILGVVSAAQPFAGGAQGCGWAAVGMMGRLVVRDDGSCEPNGYCGPNGQGIATDYARGYRVMKRIDAENVLICLR